MPTRRVIAHDEPVFLSPASGRRRLKAARRRPADPPAWPRAINLFLGVWLVLSASAWAHEDWAYSNKWLVGLAAAVVALLAFAWPKLRFVNTVLGTWLVISTLFIIPCTVCETKALWHDSVVGVLIALASLTTKRLPGASA